MNTPRACNHTPPSGPPAYTCEGRALDMRNALQLLAAASDACRPCQRRYSEDVLSGPPEVVTHLAGMAYIALDTMVRVVSGRLGVALDAGRAALTAATALSEHTRAVFSAMQNDDPLTAEQLVRDMSREARSAVLEDALDTLTSAALAMQP